MPAPGPADAAARDLLAKATTTFWRCSSPSRDRVAFGADREQMVNPEPRPLHPHHSASPEVPVPRHRASPAWWLPLQLLHPARWSWRSWRHPLPVPGVLFTATSRG